MRWSAPFPSTRLFILAAAVLLCIPASTAQDPVAIIQKMEELTRGDRTYMEMSMQVVRPRYTREIGMRTWAMGDDYSLIFITAPARDRGIGYLKRQKEIWNWMPSIDRLIKLPPSMMSQSWMGSDFTNDDLVRESSTVEDYHHKHLGFETIDGVRCHKIELVPKPDRPIVWSKVVMWIAEDHHYQVRVEQFDERGDRVNTLIFTDVKELGGRRIPARIELVPEGKKGHATVLLTHSIDFNPKVDEAFFSIQNLQRIN